MGTQQGDPATLHAVATAAEHCTPADRLNRGVFVNSFCAVRRTSSQPRLHQPAAELHRWAAHQCSTK